jgi:hypothetical protein
MPTTRLSHERCAIRLRHEHTFDSIVSRSFAHTTIARDMFLDQCSLPEAASTPSMQAESATQLARRLLTDER